MDRLTALRTFVLVAEQKSFAEAARRLRASPTAVSRAIAQLEDELGVALLRRTTRSVGVTSEGAAYLERCRRILDDLDDADRSVRGQDAEPRGTLAVTAPTVFGRMHIVPVVNGLMRAHAGLNVQLSLSDRVVRVVEEGIDLAVRIAELSDSALHAIHLAETRKVLVASPQYLAERGEPSDATQLHDHDLIVFDTLAPNNEWRFTAEGRPAIRCEPRLLTNNVDAAIEAALQGFGVARVLSYQVQEHVREGRLKYLLEALEPPPVPINLVFQASRQRTASVSAFLAACRAYCSRRAFA
jgi:DNA-binding transcriptional LysR family regulator